MDEPRRQARARPSTSAASHAERTLHASGLPPTVREAFVAVVVIAVATTLAYSNSFGGSFHFDDLPNIVRNESVRDLRNLWPPSGTRWVGTLSFALNYRFGGLDVFGFHLANFIIHVCNSLLLVWLLRTTLLTPVMRRAETGPLVRTYLPLACGLLFAVHPVQTQAVTYIVQRYASLATLFFLLSLVLYAQARLSLEAGSPSKARVGFLYGLSLASAAAAMKTKEISFTLPLVAAGYEALFFLPSPRRRFLLVPLAATALLVPLGLDWHSRDLGDVLGDASRVTAETPSIARSDYLLTQSRVVVTYVRLLLLPVHQNLDYDFRLSHSLAEPSVLFAATVVLSICGFAVLLLIRARNTNGAAGVLVFFGIAWFFVTLSVESTVIPIRDVLFEHRMYLPDAGAACALATVLLWAVERLRSPRSVRLQCAVVLALTAGPLAAAAYARNSVWRDELTLWTDVVAKSPEKARPHNNLAGALNAHGRIDEAIAEARKAISLDPAYAGAHNNLGRSFRATGQLEDAMHEFREALRLDPSLAEAHNNLGSVFLEKGELGDAAREYREALRLDPFSATARSNLGLVYEKTGEIDLAMREYTEAIRLDPRLATAHFFLGDAYRTTRRFEDAVSELRESIRLDPRQAQVHGVLGDTLEQLGRPDDAAEEYRRAWELQPRPEILFLLGRSLQAARRPAEAIATYRRFLEEAGQDFPDASKEATDRITQISSSSAPSAP